MVVSFCFGGKSHVSNGCKMYLLRSPVQVLEFPPPSRIDVVSKLGVRRADGSLVFVPKRWTLLKRVRPRDTGKGVQILFWFFVGEFLGMRNGTPNNIYVILYGIPGSGSFSQHIWKVIPGETQQAMGYLDGNRKEAQFCALWTFFWGVVFVCWCDRNVETNHFSRWSFKKTTTTTSWMVYKGHSISFLSNNKLKDTKGKGNQPFFGGDSPVLRQALSGVKRLGDGCLRKRKKSSGCGLLTL